MNENYRPKAKYGDGGAAEAAVDEYFNPGKKTEGTKHKQKVRDGRRFLNDLIKGQESAEKAIENAAKAGKDIRKNYEGKLLSSDEYELAKELLEKYKKANEIINNQQQ